jgi:hypothetical protein
MKKKTFIFLLSVAVVGITVPVLANWTCPYCGRENWDKDKVCRWCRDGAPY